MKEVPNIISTKDLSYIKDMLSWNLVMAKKSKEYLKLVGDKDVKELLKKVNEVHKSHYEMLLEIIS
ncbi:MAG TPA: hypothetical protein DD613_00050 [Firmicutes bacterium]|jgi:hypothetical protein|nr:hypothetical protein [Bacillota bacterium]